MHRGTTSPGTDPPDRAYATDDERWRAVQQRDEAADGAFYYVVRTTGIYSRPSCAARLARRENVEFHSSLEEVRDRGYRPCRRCRPDEPVPDRYHADPVARACLLMEEALEPPNLDALARSAGYSRFHFHRMFKSLTGMTPYAYWTAVRARRVREELAGARTVSDAIYQAGFNSNGQFYAASSAILGMAPQAFRTGGEGVLIRSAQAGTSLGRVLVAVADKGVCAVLLADAQGSDGDGADVDAAEPVGAAAELCTRLTGLFPRAEHRMDDAAFTTLVRRTLARADLPASARSLLPAPVLWVCLRERIRQEFPAQPAAVGRGRPALLDLRAG